MSHEGEIIWVQTDFRAARGCLFKIIEMVKAGISTTYHFKSPNSSWR